MTILLLIRHGENEWVNEKRLAGWTPHVHLNENGHRQASELAERLQDLPVEALYSSPLVRCQETAEHLSTAWKQPIQTLPEVGEVKYGAWEGAKIEDLAKLDEWHVVQHAPSRFEFPEGESLRNVQWRAVDALESLVKQHPDGVVAVVSHADLIKLVLAHYLGTHIDLFQRIGLSPASVSVLALSTTGFIRVVRMNDNGVISLPKKKEVETEEAKES